MSSNCWVLSLIRLVCCSCVLYLQAYLRWAFNDLSYSIEDTPVLLASYTGLYGKEYQPHPLTVTIKAGDYVQVVLQNGIAQNLKSENHPFHLVRRYLTHHIELSCRCQLVAIRLCARDTCRLDWKSTLSSSMPLQRFELSHAAGLLYGDSFLVFHTWPCF